MVINNGSGPSIDAFYKVSVHLAKWFQRRRLKCEKLVDDGRQVKKQNTQNNDDLLGKVSYKGKTTTLKQDLGMYMLLIN